MDTSGTAETKDNIGHTQATQQCQATEISDLH